ncbi:MAG TPA: alpha-L-arabinofuranosidase C-terminal domain-containing protein [Pyrinomonadaceae bacterium]|nr:alpha-L-arabinofuranosidase C-terminal domain-containing protein [Pyrinomonadaceae bacterium]
MTVGRREFMGGALAAGALALVAPRGAQGPEAKIEVLLNEPVGTISPNIYSHFVEHLGGVVYDGIWVGEKSKVPNIGGIRRELVEHVKRIKPGVMRWPGGCFADQYDWRDGIGPRGQRPRRVNFWADTNYKATDAYKALKDGPQKYEPNWFGTGEFMNFCRLTGAQPYFAANVRSLDVRKFLEWLEYCNAPAGLTTLSDMRAANGDREPYNVSYWGIGNESWGCGGDMTPEEYATEFRKFTAWVPTYQTVKYNFIATGPNGADVGWTRRFFSKLVEKGSGQINKVFGFGLHYYSGTTGKGDPVVYTEDEWYELIHRADRMESLITSHWAVLGENDPQRHVRLAVDEWGTWHNTQDPQMPPGYLYAYPSTLRDALVSALNLDTFQRHADKVAMANPAQLINTIHSLFLAYEDKFIVTPNFHVFEMYTPHQNGQSLRTEFIAPRVSYMRGGSSPGRQEFWGLAGSASLNGKTLTLTAVNPDVKNARETEIDIVGARVAAGQARVLTSTDIHAHNSFQNPRGLEPRDEPVSVGAEGRLVYRFSPASVTRLTLTLA